MKRNILFLGFVICGFILVSCSTTYIIGKDFNDTKVNEISIGKTDTTEVIRMFGQPFKKGQINQFEVYIYTYEENEFPGNPGFQVLIDKRYKTLFVVFDEKKIVKYFTHNIPIYSGVSLELMIISEENRKQQQENNNMNNMNNFHY